jgi:hypothetical protein
MKIMVNVNINKLILEGFSQHDVADFSKTLEAELSRIVSKNGIQNTQTFNNHNINTKNIHLQYNSGGDGPSSRGLSRGHSAGVEVAKSIYKSLVKGNA